MNEQSKTFDYPRTLGLVGVGYWGKNLARNFETLGALHTLCDADPQTLASYQSDSDEVQRTHSLEEVLDNPAITQVALAVPAARHFELAMAALEAGKDVFVEKPICLDPAQARLLVQRAQARHRILMVGHLLQYHPLVRELHSLLGRGELGKLHYITSNRLNLGRIRREENALWSFAPHDISVILSLAGAQLPERVRCMGGEYLNRGVADTTLTFLRFAGGVGAHVYVSWLNPFKEQKLTLVGSNGIAVFDDTQPWPEKLVVFRQPIKWSNGQIPVPCKSKADPIVLPEAEPLRLECAHFLDCCRGRNTPLTDGVEALRVLEVLQAAQHSLDNDGEGVPLVSSPDAGSPRSPIKFPGVSVPQNPSEFEAHPSAFVDEGARVGKGTKIWHFSHIMKGARIGERCVVGQNVNIDGGTVLCNNVKVQNNVSIYTGVVIEDDVFLGPSCVFTNVSNPRSQVNRHSLYEKTLIRKGATIGANATIVCGVTLGRYCFIGAGAVVTRDVPDYALMVGNPAQQKGWMSRHGHRLGDPDERGIMICPEFGLRYCVEAESGQLRCLDVAEEEPLRVEQAIGIAPYRELSGRDRPGRAAAA